jgi:hypothetical protein
MKCRSSCLLSQAVQEVVLEKCPVNPKFEPTERYEICCGPLKSLNNDAPIGALTISNRMLAMQLTNFSIGGWVLKYVEHLSVDTVVAR